MLLLMLNQQYQSTEGNKSNTDTFNAKNAVTKITLCRRLQWLGSVTFSHDNRIPKQAHKWQVEEFSRITALEKITRRE